MSEVLVWPVVRREEIVRAFSVVLVSVRLDDHQALMQAVPGIDAPAQRSAVPDQGAAFSPFGRTERRTLEVTPPDLDVLRGVPEPLRVLVPVTSALAPTEVFI